MYSVRAFLNSVALGAAYVVWATSSGCTGIPSWTQPRYSYDVSLLLPYDIPQLGLRISLPPTAQIVNGQCESSPERGLMAACGCPLSSFPAGTIQLREPANTILINMECSRYTPSLELSISSAAEREYKYFRRGKRAKIAYSTLGRDEPYGRNIQVVGTATFPGGPVVGFSGAHAATWFLPVIDTIDVLSTQPSPQP